MTTEEVTTLFLSDGQQTATVVASQLTEFLNAATHSLDIAIYDCALSGEAGDMIAAALRSAQKRAVDVRIAYFSGSHRLPGVPPPTGSTAEYLTTTGVQIKPVTGVGSLMHHKYVVRDVGQDGAAVWTGSMNWTIDSWQREENVVIRLPVPELARDFADNFEDLWQSGHVEGSGTHEGGDTTARYLGLDVPCRVWFSPADGETMAAAVADAIARAQRRVLFSTPVLTEGNIVGALRDKCASGSVTVRGVCDATQMHEVFQQWTGNPTARWKIDALGQIVQTAAVAGKHSTPYGSGSVHDYMHAKVFVVDDSVFTGSYNFSHSGEGNAENVLRLDSPALAESFGTFVLGLAGRYASTDSWWPAARDYPSSRTI